MAYNSYTVNRRSFKEDNYESRSPSWCIGFIRYTDSDANGVPLDQTNSTRKIFIVENDCVSVNINNSKNTFAKTCSLNMKAGQIYYLNAVNPGDWVFVWMDTHQDKIDEVVANLKAINAGGNAKGGRLTNWSSGLKFFGRVTGVQSSDSVSTSGPRNVNQVVSCQSFLELASSVYFSEALFSNLQNLNNTSAANSPTQTANIADQVVQGVSNLPGILKIRTESTQLFGYGGQYKSPDQVIYEWMRILLGVGNDGYLNNQNPTQPSLFSAPIQIPPLVGKIIGTGRNTSNIPSASIPTPTSSGTPIYLWELYTTWLGIQKYGSNDASGTANTPVWNRFNPSGATRAIAGFNLCPVRMRGAIVFQYTGWNNISIWQALSEFLNPPINEMYTALRCDVDGNIKPTLIFRERPFSTYLRAELAPFAGASDKTDQQPPQNTKTNPLTVKELIGDTAQQNSSSRAIDTSDKTYTGDRSAFTYFYELPRWVIPETIIRSINVGTDETERMNFAQVYCNPIGSAHSTPGIFQTQAGTTVALPGSHLEQTVAPNYVALQTDISRNGLRAIIANIKDNVITTNAVQLSQSWCRILGDWFFNGHLKLKGTITCTGIVEPIVEGDNCQARGMLYHIEGVQHVGTLQPNGVKSFVTVIQVSRGVLASSLNGIFDIPKYASSLGHSSTSVDTPGFVDMQMLGADRNRNDTGDYVTPTNGQDNIEANTSVYTKPSSPKDTKPKDFNNPTDTVNISDNGQDGSEDTV